MSSWWNEEVRFLQPKALRKPRAPYKLTDTDKLVLGVPAAIIVGGLASRVIHSKQGAWIIHAIVRGMIYREIIRPLLRH